MDFDPNRLYIGTVIRGSDVVQAENGKAKLPEGRVMVKIQGITQTDKHNEDYKFPLGKNIPGGVSDRNVIIAEGHEVLAYVMSPIVGGDSPGRFYNSPPGAPPGGIATYSETHDVSLVKNSGNATQGNSIANQFAKGRPDGFTGKPDCVGTAGVNTYGKNFQVNYKDGQSTGSFAIPGVGATVVVAFINGSRNMPIVLGALHGGPAVQGINSSTGAPDTYPNYPGHSGVRRPASK
jgi:hypothetical protein